MVKAKFYTLARQFEGEPNDDNLPLKEEEIAPVQDGEVLFEAEYLSVDPYMRAHAFPAGTGAAMYGEQVAKITESKNPKFKVGDYYCANFGWRTHTKVNPDSSSYLIRPVPPMGDLPRSLALGTIGMPGATAYVGLKDCCMPKKGETVLVTAGAGAVGHVVGQVAKNLGCTVIGFAGTDTKVAWLKELGFDHAFNYKTVNVGETLKKVAPDGIHCYYDNVGGSFSAEVYANHLNQGARVAIIGLISTYNLKEKAQVEDIMPTILWKRLRIRGLIISDEPYDKWMAAFKDLVQWMKEGKLKTKEHITPGFGNMRSAFYGLFKGENIGKAIVKV